MRITLLMVVLAVGAAMAQRPSEQPQGGTLQPPQSKPPREIAIIRGMQPLVAYLLPDDTALDVTDGYIPPSTSPLPPGETVIGSMTKAADLTAIVKVTKTESRFTPEQDWIESVVTSEIVGVQKNARSLKVSEGASLTFIVPDGALLIGKQRIRAFRGGAKPFMPGRSYMILATQDGDTLRSSAMTSFLIQDDKAEPMFSGKRGEAFKVETMHTEDLLQEVRVWAQAPRK